MRLTIPWLATVPTLARFCEPTRQLAEIVTNSSSPLQHASMSLRWKLICSQCLIRHANSTLLATMVAVLDECKNKTGDFAPVVIPANITRTTKSNASTIGRRGVSSPSCTGIATLFGSTSEAPMERYTDFGVVMLFIVIAAVGISQ